MKRKHLLAIYGIIKKISIKAIHFSCLVIFAILVANNIGYCNDHPHGIADVVREYANSGNNFQRVSLFEELSINQSSRNLSNYSTFVYNENLYFNVLNLNGSGLSIPIKLGDRFYEMVVVPQKVFNLGFIVTTTKDSVCRPVSDNSKGNTGLHYVGYLKNYDSSTLVSISIFEQSVWGYISVEGEGNYTISPQYDQGNHIIYNAVDALNMGEVGPFCNGYIPSEEQSREGEGAGEPTISSSKCVSVFIDVNTSVYNALGQNLARTQQYAIALFAQSASIYLNESVTIKMSRLNVWLNTSPFDSNPQNSTGRLNNFSNYYFIGFAGDVAILLDLQPFGGLARLNRGSIPCISWGNNTGYVGLGHNLGASVADGFNFYVPRYTSQIYILAHELGHLFGSKHTHECVWNGMNGNNNSALDDCYPTVGGCFSPSLANSIPPTIMSYCHQGYGSTSYTDFIHGFGQQPGDKVRFTIANSNCLYPCEKQCTYSHTLYQTTGYFSFFNSIPMLWLASHFIQSQSQYNLNSVSSHLEYNAGKYIDLKPGFEAKTSGGVFIAQIGGCDLDAVEQSTSERRRNPTENLQSDFVEPANSHNLSLSPNPATNTASLRFLFPQASPYTVIILDLTGRILSSSAQIGNKGPNEYSFSVSDLPAGTYLLRVESSGFKETRRLTVVK